MTGVEGEDVVSAQVATVTQSGLSQQVALISQDGTQHVSMHHIKTIPAKWLSESIIMFALVYAQNIRVFK